MRFDFAVLFLLMMAFASVSLAQSFPGETKTCFHPLSFKFGEFDIVSNQETQKQLLKFREKLDEESNDAKGYIFVYGGKKTRIDEIESLIREIQGVLKISETYSSNAKLWVSSGGYRIHAGIELYIRPQECSQYPTARADFDADQVEFTEASAGNTVKKNLREILKSVTAQTYIPCTAASKAVGVCNRSVDVFVIIDENGNVLFSKSLSGHPLLRGAAEKGLKNWKFTPEIIKGKNFKVTGRIIVEFTLNDSETEN